MALVRIHHIAKAGARLLCRLLRKTPLLALGGLREEKPLRGRRRLSTITCAPALLSCAKANMFLDAVARGPQLVAMLPFLNPWQTSKASQGKREPRTAMKNQRKPEPEQPAVTSNSQTQLRRGSATIGTSPLEHPSPSTVDPTWANKSELCPAVVCVCTALPVTKSRKSFFGEVQAVTKDPTLPRG